MDQKAARRSSPYAGPSLSAGDHLALHRAPKTPGWWHRHPTGVEEFVPVWGSGRDALADYYEGNYLGMIGDGALALGDLLFPGEAVARGLVKHAARGAIKGWSRGAARGLARQAAGALRGGAIGIRDLIYKPGSHSWGALRKWMLNRDMLHPHLHGHHWGLPQRLLKTHPHLDWLVNHPLNIKELKPVVHRAVHDHSRELKLNPLMRHWHGTPRAVKGLELWGAEGALRALRDLAPHHSRPEPGAKPPQDRSPAPKLPQAPPEGGAGLGSRGALDPAPPPSTLPKAGPGPAPSADPPAAERPPIHPESPMPPPQRSFTLGPSVPRWTPPAPPPASPPQAHAPPPPPPAHRRFPPFYVYKWPPT